MLRNILQNSSGVDLLTLDVLNVPFIGLGDHAGPRVLYDTVQIGHILLLSGALTPGFPNLLDPKTALSLRRLALICFPAKRNWSSL